MFHALRYEDYLMVEREDFYKFNPENCKLFKKLTQEQPSSLQSMLQLGPGSLKLGA